MKKLSCQIKLFYFKVLYALLEVITEITKANPYFVRQKIYLGAAIIAITVTINSCSSLGNRKTGKDDKKVDSKEITTTCYDAIAPIKKVEDSAKNQIPAKKQKPRFVPPVIKNDSVEISCYSLVLTYKEPITLSGKDDTLFFAEQMPEFKGGIDSLHQFIIRNLKYPEAVEQGTSGRVIIQFIVTKDGDIVKPKILRSVNPTLDNEAIRIVKSMPAWNPGKQDGQNVNVYFLLPIQFKLKE